MRRGIVIAGNILSDIVKIIDSYPEKGMLASIKDITQSVGGCVPNTIINLAQIDKGIPLKALGKIGKDNYGKYVLNEMHSYGVNTESIIFSETLPTSFSDVMTVKDTGERTFFHARGANSEFELSEEDIEELNCGIFHIGYILLLDELDKPDTEYGTKMARLLKAVQDKGIKTSIDVVSEVGDRFKKVIVPALKYCDYVIINELEAGRIADIEPRKNGKIDIENIKIIMRKISDYGVKEKVIVHCPEAGFCFDKSGKFSIVPSFELPKGHIKGTVGAGDAFCAGTLYSLYNNFDDEKLLTFANTAAACNLTQADSISGMKSSDEIFKLQKEYKRRVL